MKNEKARLFLSDISRRELEASVGTRNVVKKRMLIEKCSGLVAQQNASIESRRKKIAENLEQIESLNQTGFFKKLFSLSETRRKRAALEEQNGIIESEIKSFETSKHTFERDINILETEIADFAKILAETGVTPEDIMVEYHLILNELEEREKQIEESKIAAQKPAEAPAPIQQPKKKVTKAPSQNKQSAGRMSQIDRFNARMKKHEEMKTGSSENGNNSQPNNAE